MERNRIKYNIISKCIKSEEMKQYFWESSDKLDNDRLISIVLASNLSIYEKINILFSINDKNINDIVSEINNIITLKENEYFIVYFNYYDENLNIGRNFTIGLLNNTNNLISILSNYYSEYEVEKEELEYLCVEKWEINSNGIGKSKNQHLYFIDNEIKFVSSCKLDKYMFSNYLPNLPYKIGDIIDIDITPFYKRRKYMIKDIDFNGYISIYPLDNPYEEYYLNQLDTLFNNSDSYITSYMINISIDVNQVD